MTFMETVAVLVTAAAVFSYVNHRWVKLPTTIGLMLIGLAVSVALTVTDHFVPGVEKWAVGMLEGIDFNKTLMQGMLGFLLFAGALHININDLRERGWAIGLLATTGVVTSTLLVGSLMWCVFGWLGIEMRFVHCLLFGALISPTDPIAVMSILKTLGVSKGLETKIAGESLFNDGVGVVVFLTIFAAAGLGAGHSELTAGGVAQLFAIETLGGAVFGLAIGLMAYRMLKSVDNYQVEVLITLALVGGGYTLASRLHVSGPIAMVVAGLLIGNQGRLLAMSEKTRQHLDLFWELIDEVLNAVLFVLIGLEMVVIPFNDSYFLAGVAAIVVVLTARLVSVSLPIGVLRIAGLKLSPHVVKVLTWGGLRGAISVALALSIPKYVHGEYFLAREVIVAVTYMVVVFSIAVQGLTVGLMVRRLGLVGGTASSGGYG